MNTPLERMRRDDMLLKRLASNERAAAQILVLIERGAWTAGSVKNLLVPFAKNVERTSADALAALREMVEKESSL